ncbi:MAG: hypothetical protein ACOX3T_05345 [Bdellovibrionota bacterium]
MITIFFDLETSRTEPIGQILNYSFIATNDDFEVIDECFGDIRISPLELPCPYAILANKVDVIKHQQKNISDEKSEMMSMQRIFNFFENMIKEGRGEKIVLVGYNSLKFDVPYLRTSMIRNGFSPYFNGQIIYRDLLYVVRKISCTREDFIRTSKHDESAKKNKLSLTLETTSQNYNLLQGEQLHNSRDDVLLTINLAKKLLEIFNLDVRKYNGYELSFSEHAKYKKEGKVFTPIFPEYDLGATKNYENRFYVLLDYSDRYSLWVDLDKFKECKEASKIETSKIETSKEGSLEDSLQDSLDKFKRAISWYNYSASYLFKPIKDIEVPNFYYELAKESLDMLKDINLDNYFEISECDIEQDIYRLSFNSLDLLHKIIWENDSSVSKGQISRDLNVVLTRWKLANIKWEDINREDEKDINKLKFLEMYANHRYGKDNSLLLNKFAKKDSENKEDFHLSFFELLENIESLKEENKDNKENISLLLSLEKFYKESIIASFF